MNILRFIIPKSSVEFIYDTSTVRQAFEKMRYHRYVAIPVLNENGVYVGTIRNDDILEYLIEKSKRAAEKESVMNLLDKDYCKPLYHNAPLDRLFEEAKEHNFIPVVDDRKCFIGIILRRDVLEFLKEFYKEKTKEV
jgi:CBS domain-containing protein